MSVGSSWLRTPHSRRTAARVLVRMFAATLRSRWQGMTGPNLQPQFGQQPAHDVRDNARRRWAKAQAINAHANTYVHLPRCLVSRNRNIHGTSQSAATTRWAARRLAVMGPDWLMTKAAITVARTPIASCSNSALANVELWRRGLVLRAAPFVSRDVYGMTNTCPG
jgi:hypothetical protein